MNRITAAIAIGILSLSAAACSTPAEQAISGAIVGSLAGAGMGGASLYQSAGVASDGTVAKGVAADGAAGGPDYGAKKPHDHCGNGTMVHLGSVICSP